MVCDLGTLAIRRPWPALVCCARKWRNLAGRSYIPEVSKPHRQHCEIPKSSKDFLVYDTVISVFVGSRPTHPVDTPDNTEQGDTMLAVQLKSVSFAGRRNARQTFYFSFHGSLWKQIRCCAVFLFTTPPSIHHHKLRRTKSGAVSVFDCTHKDLCACCHSYNIQIAKHLIDQYTTTPLKSYAQLSLKMWVIM